MALFRETFRAFEHRQFRLVWIGACISSIGTLMQNTAQSWLVYDMTKREFLLGLDSFLGQVPILLFTLVGGAFADQHSRRNLLLTSQFVQMTAAFVLTALVFLQAQRVEHILALSFLVGLAQAFGGPAYQALIPALVGPKDVPNAIAMNSIQFNVARVLGPLAGGLALTSLGAVWCFGLNGLSYLAVIASLYTISATTGMAKAPANRTIAQSIREGLSFVRRREGMIELIILSFLMTTLGFSLIPFLPVVASKVLGGNEQTFTWLLSASGVGSVIGALLVAAFSKRWKKGLTALWVLVALGVSLSAFAASHVLLLSLLFAMIGGACLVTAISLIASLVQEIVPDEMRGRVMSVYNVAFRGGMPIGSLITGSLASRYSIQYVLATEGALLSLIGLYFLLVRRRVAQL